MSNFKLYRSLRAADSDSFGEATAEAVRAFQRASLLDVTGRIDLQTYNRLARAFHSISAY